VFVGRYKDHSKINIWDCFNSSGFGRVKSNLTGRKLTKIYKNDLLRSFPSISNGNQMLAEDNDLQNIPPKLQKVIEN